METYSGEPFEALGEWFVSDIGEDSVIGTLSFNRVDGLHLRVVNPSGRLDQRSFRHSEEPSTAVTAYGHTLSHGHFTLQNGFLRSQPSSSHGPSERSYYFNRGYLGVADDDADSLNAKAVAATCDLLRVFLNRDLVLKSSLRSSKTVTIRHRIPQSIRVQIAPGTHLRFAWSRKGPTYSIAQSDVTISSRTWISIEHRRRVPVDNLLADVDLAGRLVSLLIGEEFDPDLIQLTIAQKSGRKFQPKTAFHLAAKLEAINSKRNRDLIPQNLIFRYDDVADRFASMFSKWRNLYAIAPGCINTYFSASYSTFVNQRLFAITSAIEAFHRHTVRKKASLRDRLVDVLGLSPALTSETIESPNMFAAQVVKYRNAEAHCDDSALLSSGSEIARITAKLRVHFDNALMMHVGLQPAEIHARMKAAYEYWWYASSATWPWRKWL